MESLRNMFEVLLQIYVWGLLTIAVVSALLVLSWIETR